MKSLKSAVRSQQGIVGLVVLGLGLVLTIAVAGYYVYRVRTGDATPIIGTAVPKPTVPAVVKQDGDAAAAESAGETADHESLDDLTVGNADLQ
jgi:hypothetical protein